VTVTPAPLARVVLGLSAVGLSVLLTTACTPTPHAFQSPPPPTSAVPVPDVTPSTGREPTASPEPLLPAGYSTADVPPVVSNGDRTGNRVALTFDADMTTGMAAKLASGQARSYANLKVLDILEQRGIPATFFLTGMWVEQYPDVTRRLAANPAFELANHTYTHRAYTPNCYTLAQVPAAEMAVEITHTFDLIRPYGGRQTNYFRFPGLCLSPAALDRGHAHHRGQRPDDRRGAA
jgi:peptidoglycan-N-acetylglucosamine deacetylase